MSKRRRYACYNSKGVKLGLIILNSNHDNHRLIFLENKSMIKQKYPGTAFIKPA